ncbi:MAG: hypothetical protein LQ346_003352 [Caloplaca aetnensis]|nr:MAG: hypothetical protein LQ346_003352 [Caloplaca aetnensis]
MGNNSAVIYEQYFRPWQQIKALEARLCEVIFTFRQSNFSYLVGLQAPIATLQSIEACITQHEARLDPAQPDGMDQQSDLYDTQVYHSQSISSPKDKFMHTKLLDPCEPQVEPLPFLHPSFKAQIDEDYMSFSVVWQRIWPFYLQEPLEAFCREKGPHIFHKEVLCAKVRDLMTDWCKEPEVAKGQETIHAQRPEFRGQSNRQILYMWRTKLTYELLVRRWHAARHIVKYEAWAAGELSKKGYKIGI